MKFFEQILLFVHKKISFPYALITTANIQMCTSWLTLPTSSLYLDWRLRYLVCVAYIIGSAMTTVLLKQFEHDMAQYTLLYLVIYSSNLTNSHMHALTPLSIYTV